MRLSVSDTDDAEVAAVTEVLNSGFLTQGPRAARFEEGIARVAGTRFGFATSSATTGLHLALHALGVGPGDEVVVPDFSFPATANAVVQLGALPVFVDIDPTTFNLDPDLLERAIGRRTRAVMPVHAFGLCADMDPIVAVADRHGLPVVEDAACALRGEYRGRPAGSLATAGVFSFHPRKIITTGEGGVVTTSDETLADRIRVLRSHGGVRGELYLDFVDAGFNYRLSDIHAAIGLAQLDKLDRIVSDRRRLAAELSRRLDGIAGIVPPSAPEGILHTYQSYVVMLEDSLDRDAIIRAMRSRGVETTLGTYAMHLQPYFRARFGIRDEDLPRATRAHRQAITLPLYPRLGDADLDTIVRALAESLGDQR